MERRFAAIAVVWAFALCAGPASAGTQTATITVTANVAQSCTAITPSSGTLTFPTYDSFASQPDNDTTPVTFTTNCTKGASNVYFSVGGGSNCTNSPIAGDRAMKNSSSYLAYQLYQDSSYSTPWTINSTSCAGTTQVSAGTITSNSQNLSFSIYGQIPAGQDAVAGNGYSDSLNVTVNY